MNTVPTAGEVTENPPPPRSGLRHFPRDLRRALLLGAAPLIVGTLIYGTWRLTRWEWLEIAGMVHLCLGLISFCVGMFRVARYVWRGTGGQSVPSLRRWGQAGLVAALLLSNLPAAAFYTISAINVATRYTIRVHNESGLLIESLVVTGPGVHFDFGPIAPGRWARRHFHFGGDGSLQFTARQPGVEFGGQLEGYVTGGSGGEKTVRVKSKGVYECETP